MLVSVIFGLIVCVTTYPDFYIILLMVSLIATSYLRKSRGTDKWYCVMKFSVTECDSFPQLLFTVFKKTILIFAFIALIIMVVSVKAGLD